jgi:hypothetical protein
MEQAQSAGDTMFAILSSCMLVLLGSVVAQIPKEPDFSGEWVLVKASGTRSDPAPSLTVRQTITRTTVRGEPMTPWFSDLTVERHFRTGVVSENYKIGMSGGSVSGTATAAQSPRREERTTVAVKWEAESLIIRTGRYSGPPHESGPYTEHEEVWSIDQSGRLLITITDRSSGSQPAAVTLIYRRQPNPVALELAPRGICEREATKLAGTAPVRVGKGVRTPKKACPPQCWWISSDCPESRVRRFCWCRRRESNPHTLADTGF